MKVVATSPSNRFAATEKWQEILGINPDGVFGPLTEAKTKIWQSEHNISPDGVVGPVTWAAAGVRPAPPTIFKEGTTVYHSPTEGSVEDIPLSSRRSVWNFWGLWRNVFGEEKYIADSSLPLKIILGTGFIAAAVLGAIVVTKTEEPKWRRV